MNLLKTTILLALVAVTLGRKFTFCSLAKELRRHGIPRNQIPNWVCLVNSESGMNTKATNRNKNGSTDYGLFQINSGYWCSPGPHNICRVKCRALLSDNISVAVKCARRIHKSSGFKAWYGWQARCRGRNLSRYVRGCKY